MDTCEPSPKITLRDANSLTIIPLFFEQDLCVCVFPLWHLQVRGNCQGCWKMRFLCRNYLCQQKGYNENWGNQLFILSSLQNCMQRTKCGKCICSVDIWVFSRTAISCWVYSPVLPHTGSWCPYFYPGTQKVFLLSHKIGFKVISNYTSIIKGPGGYSE